MSSSALFRSQRILKKLLQELLMLIPCQSNVLWRRRNRALASAVPSGQCERNIGTRLVYWHLQASMRQENHDKASLA
jgi:hypothetical protein